MGTGIFYNISVENNDPDGIKIIENPNKTLKALLFPRHRLQEFRASEEAKKAGVYILYNSLDKNEKPHIYIGQSGFKIIERLNKHNRKRDFWNQALVFVEKGNSNSLNGTHTKRMESMMIEKAEASGFCVMENDDGSNAPSASKADIATAEIWANEVITITQLIGLAFFVDKEAYQPNKSDDAVEKQTEKKQANKKQPYSENAIRKLPDLPDDSLKVGKYVRTAMENLMSIDWFSDSQLDFLSSADKTFALTHLTKCPLLFELKDGQNRKTVESSITDRYWAKVFVFSGRSFLLFSQWYPDNHKNHSWKSEFVDFYKNLK